MHRRGTLLSIAVSLSFVVSLVSPARAATTGWDPNDVSGRLDLRWVGVDRQDADTVRVAITFWDPVRDWMLPRPDHWRQLYIFSWGFQAANTHGQGYIFFSAEANRWLIEWIDSGSGAPFRHPFPATHPNPYLFQVYIPAANATGIAVFSCDHAVPHSLPGCSVGGIPGPPQIEDWIPRDFDVGLDPA
jgi:hypothetical protein